ncbi:hypothetical protein GCM10029963_17410 [Micromonospora andamanensis]
MGGAHHPAAARPHQQPASAGADPASPQRAHRRVAGQSASSQRPGSASPPTPARDTHLLHSDADPLRKWGAARETHPEQWDAAIQEARELGVEITFREGGLAYGPGPSPGQPGHLILDPDASYGALLHEMQHLREDQAAGWVGMRGWFEDPVVRYENEVRAYQQEIRYAESIGDRDSVERLNQLIREEYAKIFGEEP